MALPATPQAELRAAALVCLSCAEPTQKVVLTLKSLDAAGISRLAECEATPSDASHFPLKAFREQSRQLPAGFRPGRPARPQLVAARSLPSRGLGSVEGRAAFVHAIAHIEFNAINLAWDAVARFDAMPAAFYREWAAVAADEARHFQLLEARLHELGSSYGAFDAHDGLWDMAMATADSCLARMALVPRVLEARGLDVTPAMIVRLRAVGDDTTAEILELILREEVAHVEVGSRWFRWCCERDGLDPDLAFRSLLQQHARGVVRGPFNLEARRRAGFSEAELDSLQLDAGASG